MKINEKEYEIITNIKWKYKKLLQKEDLTSDDIEMFLKQITKPKLTQKVIDELTDDDMFEIIFMFHKLEKKKNIGFKKKLSRL